LTFSQPLRPLSGVRILIVDDDAAYGERLAAILQRRGGAEAAVAISIPTARGRLASAISNIALIDHNLGPSQQPPPKEGGLRLNPNAEAFGLDTIGWLTAARSI
jgi:ActR/RegA family two-component response regulator